MERKSTLLFIAILFSSSLVNAQIKQGSFLLGGNLSFDYGKTKYANSENNTSTTGATIDISAGKAVSENRVVGIRLQYSPVNSKSNTGSSSQTRNSYGGSVFYRKYKNLSKDFYLFLGIEGGYYFSKYEVKDYLGNSFELDKTNNGQLSLYPGLSYGVMKHLQLEVALSNFMSLSYQVAKLHNQNQSDRTSNSISFNSSLNGGLVNNLSVGFRLIF